MPWSLLLVDTVMVVAVCTAAFVSVKVAVPETFGAVAVTA